MALAEMSSIEIDEGFQAIKAMAVTTGLIDSLSAAGISNKLTKAMERFRANFEGERGLPWFEIRYAGYLEASVQYQEDDSGQRVLWIGYGFVELLASNQPDQKKVEAIGEFIYQACLCSDGHKDWAENRRAEFLSAADRLSMLYLSS